MKHLYGLYLTHDEARRLAAYMTGAVDSIAASLVMEVGKTLEDQLPLGPILRPHRDDCTGRCTEEP